MLQGVEKHTLNDYIKYVRERNGVEKMSVYQKYRRLKRASDAAVAGLGAGAIVFLFGLCSVCHRASPRDIVTCRVVCTLN